MAQKLRDKTVFPQSPTTSWREREPTAPEIVRRGMSNMSVDFSRQQAVVPSRLGATMVGSRTMNGSGRPMALDVMNGGSPDDPARGPGLEKSRQKLAPTTISRRGRQV